jgi:hypothetical protein
MQKIVPRPTFKTIYLCNNVPNSCVPLPAGSAAALALTFVNKIAILPENIFTAMFNDRLVTKGTVVEVLTVFCQVCAGWGVAFLLKGWLYVASQATHSSSSPCLDWRSWSLLAEVVPLTSVVMHIHTGVPCS